MRHPFALAAIAAATALLIAGCGSSSSNSASSGATATGAVTQSTAAASTASSTAPAAGVAVVTTKHGKYGTILAGGAKHMTLYLFEADKGSTSSCTGECAKDWPPLTTAGAPRAAGGAIAADLATTQRADGAMQVTYKGHPLYYFERDTESDDAYGQGSKAFGAEWYVLSPSGSKVEEAGASSQSGASSSNSSNSSNMGSSGY